MHVGCATAIRLQGSSCVREIQNLYACLLQPWFMPLSECFAPTASCCKLQIMCRELSQYLRAKRSLAAPIRRLPLELLQDVFLFAVISDTYSAASNIQKRVSLRKALGAIRLAHVCSYWRVIALDTGQLWATILLRPSDISGITQLGFHTAHAKSTPLTILCHEWVEPRVLNKLARLSHRWRNVTLHVDCDFKELDGIRQKIPLLESLSLIYTRFTTDVFRDAPSLRRVALVPHQRFHELLQPFDFMLPWHQLTFLALEPVPFPLFSEFVRECPQLLYLNVTLSWSAFDPLPAPRTTETHNSLRKLVLRGASSPRRTSRVPSCFPFSLGPATSKCFPCWDGTSKPRKTLLRTARGPQSSCFWRPRPCASCISEIGAQLGTRRW
ncbi:hypothetical protein C8R45DRAFT_308350 [Mycena sanguinolenta]|nr:hypothetical protein C8R45DRAFT_308350 [Mycena sanguinolenta]